MLFNPQQAADAAAQQQQQLLQMRAQVGGLRASAARVGMQGLAAGAAFADEDAGESHHL